MKNAAFLNLDPATIELMIKTNVHPYVYLTKYALQHFRNNKDAHSHKNALIYTSSIIAMTDMTNTSHYTGTKTHNYLFGRMVA